MDVVFVMDSSTSVGPRNWMLQLKFLIDLTQPLKIGSKAARVAMVTFNTQPKLVFGFDRYLNSKSLHKAIRKAMFTEGLTFTGEALKFVLKNLVPKMRRNVPKLLFLVTDGQSNGEVSPVEMGKKIKEKGVNIFTVGISNEIYK